MQNESISITPKPISVIEFVSGVRAWINYLLARWWVFLACCMLAGLAGAAVAYFEKEKYESHLTFALEEGDNSLGGAINLAAEFGLNLGSSSNLFQGDNIVSLLTSRRIIERVFLSVDTLGGEPLTIAEYYKRISRDSTKKLSNAESRINSVSFPVSQSRDSFTYLQDSVLKVMYTNFIQNGSLKVGKPDKRLNLYEVSVVSADERFTKVFTERLIKEASEFYTELKSKKSRQTLEILEERVAQTKGYLNSAISNRAAIQDADINPAFQAAQAPLQKKQLEITAYGGAYSELYKNLELARYQYLKDIPLLQIIDGAEYPMKKIKRGRALTAVIFAFFTGIALLIFFSASYLFKQEKLRLKVAEK